MQQVADEERKARFNELIKGEFKDLYGQSVQDIVRARLKDKQGIVDKYNALTPTLETLSRKYGVDASDVDALNAAIESDDTYWEEEALELGVSVDQLRSLRKMERENAALKAQIEESKVRADAERIYAGWMEQADKLTQVYPSFNLEAELANPQFQQLLNAGIDMRTSFEVIHKDDIIQAGMQFATQQTAQKLTNKIMSGGRPAENGMRSQASAVVKQDVSRLTKAQRQEYIRRAAMGERIEFR